MIDAGEISCLVIDYEYRRLRMLVDLPIRFTNESSLEEALKRVGNLGARTTEVYCKSKAEAKRLAAKLVDHDFIVEMRNFPNSHVLFVSWR